MQEAGMVAAYTGSRAPLFLRDEMVLGGELISLPSPTTHVLYYVRFRKVHEN